MTVRGNLKHRLRAGPVAASGAVTPGPSPWPPPGGRRPGPGPALSGSGSRIPTRIQVQESTSTVTIVPATQTCQALHPIPYRCVFDRIQTRIRLIIGSLVTRGKNVTKSRLGQQLKHGSAGPSHGPGTTGDMPRIGGTERGVVGETTTAERNLRDSGLDRGLSAGTARGRLHSLLQN